MFSLLAILLVASGCATYFPSELVTAKYKPKKVGVVKMFDGDDDEGRKVAKQEATVIMKLFCQPLNPEIEMISSASEATGSTSTSSAFLPGITFNNTDFKNSKLVYFTCEESKEELSL